MKNLNYLFVAGFCLFMLSGFQLQNKHSEAKKLFTEEYNCNECHGVKATHVKMLTKKKTDMGSDLSGFKSKNTFAEISAYVKKEANMDGKSHKKPFKGTDEELQTILDWLGSLEAQE